MHPDIRTVILAALLLSLTPGCVDSVEPAGPGQYQNPDYPSELIGYASVSAAFTGAFDYQGRIFVMNQESNLMESFSLDDPNLNMSSIPVEKDTLVLGFTPGAFALDRASGTLFLESRDDYGVYGLQLPDGSPWVVKESQSIITGLHMSDGALIICYLGPEWLARKVNPATGDVLGEFSTGWPITRTALSPDGGMLLLSNSGKEFLLIVDPETMSLEDTVHTPERIGTFLVNTEGNIVLFNQSNIHPAVYLFSGQTGEELYFSSIVNPYLTCSLIPGTDVVIAPRRSENRVSILNSQNMIFAPSIPCFQYADIAFATEDSQNIIVLTDTPGRVYVYSHQ